MEIAKTVEFLLDSKNDKHEDHNGDGAEDDTRVNSIQRGGDGKVTKEVTGSLDASMLLSIAFVMVTAPFVACVL